MHMDGWSVAQWLECCIVRVGRDTHGITCSGQACASCFESQNVCVLLNRTHLAARHRSTASALEQVRACDSAVCGLCRHGSEALGRRDASVHLRQEVSPGTGGWHRSCFANAERFCHLHSACTRSPCLVLFQPILLCCIVLARMCGQTPKLLHAMGGHVHGRACARTLPVSLRTQAEIIEWHGCDVAETSGAQMVVIGPGVQFAGKLPSALRPVPSRIRCRMLINILR